MSCEYSNNTNGIGFYISGITTDSIIKLITAVRSHDDYRLIQHIPFFMA